MKESINFKYPRDDRERERERERERDWFQNDLVKETMCPSDLNQPIGTQPCKKIGLLLSLWSPRCLFLPRKGQ